MVHNSAMRLDHVSYVTSHDQLADTVQRLGSRLGVTFTDGGVHPRFGTRNFTAALRNRQYIEVVCPLEHPAALNTPWGKTVSKKAAEGGGWLTWVFDVQDITAIEKKFGRSSIDGHRVLPDGKELKWKQIGVRELMDNPELPFFIEWISEEHPSLGGDPVTEISKISIADSTKLAKSWLTAEILDSLDGKIILSLQASEDGENGIIEISFVTPHGIITSD